MQACPIPPPFTCPVMEDHDTIININQKVEQLCKTLLDNGQPGFISSTDKRLKDLEKWRSYISGALFAIGFSSGALFAKLIGIIPNAHP